MLGSQHTMTDLLNSPTKGRLSITVSINTKGRHDLKGNAQSGPGNLARAPNIKHT